MKASFSSIAAGGLLTDLSREPLLAQGKATAGVLNQAEDSEAYWDLVKAQFTFVPGLYYFNNASLGPSPELVADATESFRHTLDGLPSKYMWGGWNTDKEQTREKAAAAVGATAEEIALIHNTTEGMNLVAASMYLEPGDEVILADHEHTSGTIPWKYWQETKGIELVRPTLPLIPETPGEIVDVYRQAITPRTKVISMCHMVNTNGMILPVRDVVELARPRNILVAVDGAQTAGMFPFDLHDMGCDYYAASSHKWLFSPKGVGIFYAREEAQQHLRPLIVANGYEDESVRRFENYNTRNLPELLGLGVAIDFHNLLGAERKGARIYDLKHYFREKISDNTAFNIKTPAHDELSCGITTVELVGHRVIQVERRLADDYNINVRPMSSFGLNGLRISLSVFNTKEDVDYLVDVLQEIADREPPLA
ncbi:MAG: aminotransferase class V-fold PLP-dependent enzyme [Gemmatimonadetes bacterium]|nr:aminotransferase class V-fold PLP-dependent enzyme [Gemmatimonadota bacterium]